ncbi:MAG: MFS transporter [Deltaproteobacteria bacterium]|nr:MFS transporter [Deltaproteobacteria bacterium]
MAPSHVPWWREPTRKQWASFCGAWLAWILDAFDVAIFLLAMPAISRELGVSTIATTGSMALTLLARLLGGAFAGAAADKWGRKLPLILAVVWFAICDGLIAVAPTFAAILALRTLFGLGMGAQYAAGMTLAMENWPERSRGIASGVLQGSWAIGNLVAGVIAAFVLPRFGFRALFAISVIPAVLLVVFLVLAVPESEEWLRTRGRRTDSKLAKATGGTANLLWGCVTMAAGLGAYYALTTLYPTILETELGLRPAKVGGLVALFYGGMLAGAITTGIIAARRGTTLAIVVPALLAVPILPLYVGVDPRFLAVGAVLGGAFGVGFSGVVPLLLTQLYPAEQRARLVGLSYHIGSALAAPVPVAIAWFSRATSTSLSRSVAFAALAFELLLVVLIVSRAVRPVTSINPAALSQESS